MNASATKVVKIPRIRKGPQKKWTKAETESILTYMLDTVQNNLEIEKPTANAYYTKFLKKTPDFSVSCDLIRNKVRNLKTQYRRAVDWLKTTGKGVLEDDDKEKDYILQICPFWDFLDRIFRYTVHIDPLFVIDSIESTNNDADPFDSNNCAISVKSENYESDDNTEDNGSSIAAAASLENSTHDAFAESSDFLIDERFERTPHDNARLSPPPPLPPLPPPSNVNNKSNGGDGDGALDLALELARASRAEIQKRKLIIEEKRLKMEEDWRSQKIKLKKQRLDLEWEKLRSQESIERAKIEKDERIARYEIEMKYKVQLELAKCKGHVYN